MITKFVEHCKSMDGHDVLFATQSVDDVLAREIR